MREEEIGRRAGQIELILMDVDGVLTDGKISYTSDEGKLVEVKSFNVLDGAGIALAHRAGLETGIISGRASPAVTHRAHELGIAHVHIDCFEKLPVFEQILQKTGLGAEQVCYMGDEVLDLPVMTRVGLSAAPANACVDVKHRADYVAEATGGNGAVREVIELVLKAKGKWDGLIAEFLR